MWDCNLAGHVYTTLSSADWHLSGYQPERLESTQTSHPTQVLEGNLLRLLGVAGVKASNVALACALHLYNEGKIDKHLITPNRLTDLLGDLPSYATLKDLADPNSPLHPAHMVLMCVDTLRLRQAELATLGTEGTVRGILLKSDQLLLTRSELGIESRTADELVNQFMGCYITAVENQRVTNRSLVQLALAEALELVEFDELGGNLAEQLDERLLVMLDEKGLSKALYDLFRGVEALPTLSTVLKTFDTSTIAHPHSFN